MGRRGIARLATEKKAGRSATSPVSDRPVRGLQGGVASLAPFVVAQRRAGVNQIKAKWGRPGSALPRAQPNRPRNKRCDKREGYRRERRA
jgi:hypothetical protein